MRIRSFLLLCCFATAASAQDVPQVSVELQSEKTIVGQPLIVRIKVLVPTFSPSPPEFPALEAPGLVVRLPERASGPVSESVAGETWSGVQRSYRVYPLQPGRYDIPAQTVRVSYAEPGGIDPIIVELNTDIISFEATIPAGAEGLSPLIVAQDFSLKQTADVPEDFAVGDAIERTIEAKITGTTPILIPQLLGTETNAALRIYPKEPVVTESEDRGILSGQKTEALTYLAVAPGMVNLPGVEVQWFNLETEQIETARVDGFDLVVGGEVAAQAREPVSRRVIVFGLFALIASCILIVRLLPRVLLAHRDSLTAQWQETEHFKARQVMKSIHQRDLVATYRTLEIWDSEMMSNPPSALVSALTEIGRRQFGYDEKKENSAAWRGLSQTFAELRKAKSDKKRAIKSDGDLPWVNPWSASKSVARNTYESGDA